MVQIRPDGYIVKAGDHDFEAGHEYDLVVQALDVNGKTVCYCNALPKYYVFVAVADVCEVCRGG